MKIGLRNNTLLYSMLRKGSKGVSYELSLIKLAPFALIIDHVGGSGYVTV